MISVMFRAVLNRHVQVAEYVPLCGFGPDLGGNVTFI